MNTKEGDIKSRVRYWSWDITIPLNFRYYTGMCHAKGKPQNKRPNENKVMISCTARVQTHVYSLRWRLNGFSVTLRHPEVCGPEKSTGWGTCAPARETAGLAGPCDTVFLKITDAPPNRPYTHAFNLDLIVFLFVHAQFLLPPSVHPTLSYVYACMQKSNFYAHGTQGTWIAVRAIQQPTTTTTTTKLF